MRTYLVYLNESQHIFENSTCSNVVLKQDFFLLNISVIAGDMEKYEKNVS